MDTWMLKAWRRSKIIYRSMTMLTQPQSVSATTLSLPWLTDLAGLEATSSLAMQVSASLLHLHTKGPGRLEPRRRAFPSAGMPGPMARPAHRQEHALGCREGRRCLEGGR